MFGTKFFKKRKFKQVHTLTGLKYLHSKEKMKIIDKWFYVVYNSYYKHGNFTNDHPTWTVGGIFTVVVFCLIFLMDYARELYIYGLRNIPKTNVKYRVFEPSTPHLMGLIGFGVVYILFFYKKRYELIYEAYKDDDYLNTKNAKFMAFALVIFVIISPFITPLILHAVF